jgi:hypothetical protein
MKAKPKTKPAPQIIQGECATAKASILTPPKPKKD